MERFEKSVLRFISESKLIEGGSRIVVALSGGADSTALAHLLARRTDDIGCSLVGGVHFNHLLRGTESDDDAEFAASVCDLLGIRFIGGSGQVEQYGAKNKISIEQAGRRLRYAFFENSRRMLGADFVALAHHADDNLETVLINLVRGSGPRGLAGIRPVRRCYIRPFLSVSKNEILDYLEQNNLAWRSDATNDEPIYLRNRIRHNVIPALIAENRNLAQTVLRNSRLAADEDAMLDRIAGKKLEQIAEPEDGRDTIDIKRLLEADPVWVRRMIRIAIGRVCGDLSAISAERVEALIETLRGNKRSAIVEFPGGVLAEISYNDLIISRSGTIDRCRESGGSEPPPAPKSLDLVGRTDFGSWVFSVCLLAAPPEKISQVGENRLLINPAEIDGELVLRPAKKGERIRLFGGGRKKISDIYIDFKIPRRLRASRPLLADDRGTLWLPGVARSDRAPINSGSASCLLVEIINQPE